NHTAGSFTVTATAAGIPTPALFHLTNTPGSPTSVTAVGGTPQSGVVGTPYRTALQVQVTDSFGNAVVGTAVTFTAPSSGPSGSFGASPTVLTDAQGEATAPTF